MFLAAAVHQPSIEHLMAKNYGERLLPSTLDETAKADPGRLYAVISNSLDLSDGFRDVCFAEVARSVDVLANHLEDAFGGGQDTEIVAYLGIPDLREAIAFLAAIKCGYKDWLSIIECRVTLTLRSYCSFPQETHKLRMPRFSIRQMR